MKFQCDRCKTRYSIADERVAGKILKIRCKNCSAVITVREGMKYAATTKGAVVGVAKKRASTPMQKVVTPAASSKPQSRSKSALQGAFQKAMTQPDVSPGDSLSDAPAALQEEWYVSIDGDQSGPFSLVQARDWVGKQAHGADLHCWAEGFDDWRPVAKVNHLRGALKPPPPRRRKTAPPPIPNLAPKIEREVDSDFDDDERTVIDQNAGDIAAAMAASSSPVLPAAIQPLAAKPVTPAPAAKPSTPFPKPTLSNPATPAALGAIGNTPAPDPDTPKPLFASAMANLINEAEAATDAAVPSNGQSATSETDDMDLDIGEASRVVRLPLPAPSTPRPLGAAGLPGVAASSLGRGSGTHGSLPVVGMTGPQQATQQQMDMPGQLAPIAPQKRRSLLIPLILAGVAILGGGSALLLMSMKSAPEDTFVTRGRVGGSSDIARTRDMPRTKRGGPAEVDPTKPRDPAVKKSPGTNRRNPNPNRNPGKTIKVIDDPFVEVTIGDSNKPGGPLRPDEVAATIRAKHLALKMCYERALKKNPLLEVPKSKMTMRIGSDGRVMNVVIPKLVGTNLGDCILARVKGWKFRKARGTFTGQFPLVFGR